MTSNLLRKARRGIEATKYSKNDVWTEIAQKLLCNKSALGLSAKSRVDNCKKESPKLLRRFSDLFKSNFFIYFVYVFLTAHVLPGVPELSSMCGKLTL